MSGRSFGSDGVGSGILLVLTTALVSGVSTFVNAYAVVGTNSDAFVTVRNVAVALILVPLVAVASLAGARRVSLVRADWLRLAVIGLVGGAVPFLLFFHGLQLAGKGAGGLTASFVYRTLFLFATVFGLVFLRERLAWKGFAGAALLLGGSYLLLSLGSPVWNDGTVYVLVATILWAAEYTLSKRTLARLPSATVALGRMGFGAVFLVGYLALTGQVGAPSAFSGVQWEWVAISAVLLAAFVGTWYAGLARVELSVATAVLVLGYPVTWVLSVALQGKALLPAPAAGAAAVVAGVSIVVGLRGMRASWRRLKQGLRVGTQAPG